MMSGFVPAPTWTTTFTGRVGQFCACRDALASSAAAKRTRAALLRLDIEALHDLVPVFSPLAQERGDRLRRAAAVDQEAHAEQPPDVVRVADDPVHDAVERTHDVLRDAAGRG